VRATPWARRANQTREEQQPESRTCSRAAAVSAAPAPAAPAPGAAPCWPYTGSVVCVAAARAHGHGLAACASTAGAADEQLLPAWRENLIS
jgi:hypothetical protein